eukprot:COSAG06_NODE_10783_length_1617_cov_1.291173_2_plen_120_part_00
MAMNYKKFGTLEEVEAYLLTEWQDFVGKKEARKLVRIGLIVGVILLGLGLLAFVSQQLHDWFGCGGDWFGMWLHCSALKKLVALIVTYQTEIMWAAGSSAALIVGVCAEKVVGVVLKVV